MDQKLIEQINQLNREELLGVLEHTLFELRHTLWPNKDLTPIERQTLETALEDIKVYLDSKIDVNEYYGMEYDAD